MKYLLDTNTCITYIRGRTSALQRQVDTAASPDIVLCSVVRAELFRGIYRSSDPSREQARVLRFVGRFVSLPFDDRAAEVAGRIRVELERLGLPISPYDGQIAAIALVHNLALVTHNVREFSRVVGLRVEDWEVRA